MFMKAGYTKKQCEGKRLLLLFCAAQILKHIYQTSPPVKLTPGLGLGQVQSRFKYKAPSQGTGVRRQPFTLVELGLDHSHLTGFRNGVARMRSRDREGSSPQQ